jgi:hypothetical protein
MQVMCLTKRLYGWVRFLPWAIAVLSAAQGCKEAETTNRPPAATATAGAVFTYGGTGQNLPNTGTNPTGAAASGGAGVGCASPDAVPVPQEPGLRECCRKLDPQMTACLGSACWGPGFAEKVKADMVPGGRCAP